MEGAEVGSIEGAVEGEDVAATHMSMKLSIGSSMNNHFV